jgi:tRNA dimethylallyltransferase
MKNPIIVLTGPTASGKTSISLNLAKLFDCEIICADSMTVYRGMNIGTDKPSQVRNSKFVIRNFDKAHIIEGIPHHLLNIIDPDEEFNVSIFCKKVREIIKDIHSRGKVPMLVGGSVMYIDAFVYDYKIPEVAPNKGFRKNLEEKSNEELFVQLCKFDPDCEWTVDKNNKRRLIRAIEICQATGRPLAEQKTKKVMPKNIIYLAVNKEREELYSQINKRVDDMFKRGFVEEVRKLHNIYDHNTAMQAAGYKQICEFLDGKTSVTDAIIKTKQTHRNYAKRQLTWLRRNEDIYWIKDTAEAKGLLTKFLL